MKFIHTSDWHLGRIFYGIRLTEDQAVVLDQLIMLIKDEKPDLVIVAGDVYDRAVPPPEAVELLDDVLSRIVLGQGVPVLLIAGNHDNPQRLGFGARLLKTQGLHVVCSYEQQPEPVIFRDSHGPVTVYPLPYAEPAQVRQVLKDDTLHSHNSAMKALINRIQKKHDNKTRAIIVSHSFAAGGEESESERPLSIGGAGTIDASLFSFADFTALGHLHKYQKIGKKEIYYSGSLLKYSFSESTQTKSVQVVEMDSSGVCTVRPIPLKPEKDVRCIEGYFADLIKNRGTGSPPFNSGIMEGSSVHDYLMVTLLDQGVILDVMTRLRDVYPNLLHIRKPVIEAGEKRNSVEQRKLGEQELFASFVLEVTGEEITPDQEQEFAGITEKLRKKERTE